MNWLGISIETWLAITTVILSLVSIAIAIWSSRSTAKDAQKQIREIRMSAKKERLGQLSDTYREAFEIGMSIRKMTFEKEDLLERLKATTSEEEQQQLKKQLWRINNLLQWYNFRREQLVKADWTLQKEIFDNPSLVFSNIVY